MVIKTLVNDLNMYLSAMVLQSGNSYLSSNMRQHFWIVMTT
jgi:hypothetical protein